MAQCLLLGNVNSDQKIKIIWKIWRCVNEDKFAIRVNFVLNKEFDKQMFTVLVYTFIWNIKTSVL
jgi:hypothetical protein